MSPMKHGLAASRVVAIAALGGLSLSACATKDYVDQQIATVTNHVNAVDAKATDASQKADAANSAAQSAGAAAQQAMASAQQANQRLDQLTPRVDAIEQRLAAKRPRN